jgi:hypothetical protein
MDTQTFQREPVLTVLAVAKGLVVPNYVYREPGSGAWVALPSRQQKERLLATHWDELLREDHGLLELRQLEPGKAVERPDPSGRWRLIHAEAEAEPRAAPSREADRYEQELRVAGHADLLRAYLVLLGVAGLVIAGFAFMLHGRIPEARPQGLDLGAQVHTWWWQLIAVGVWSVIWGVVAGSRRAGWAGLLGAAAPAALGLWVWQASGQVWLPAPVAMVGLGVLLAWRSLALAASNWRYRRLARAQS